MRFAAWASTDELTAADLEDGSESFSVANWNTEQDGMTNLTNSLIITLDEGARSQADSGMLTYNMNVWGSCDECRTMELVGKVTFLDVEGNAVGEWSDSYEEYDTWRQQHSLSGTGIVPAGTASIEASVENDVGTKSDLELTGTLTISTTGVDTVNGHNATYNIDSFAGTGTFDMHGGVTAHYATSRDVKATEDRMADLRSSLTIFFGADARKSIADGIAFYNFYADFSDLAGGHTLDCALDVRFFDASGNEISESRVSLTDSDFGGFISYAEKSKVVFSTGDEENDLPIPANAAYVKMEGKATVGTLTDLASWMRFICYHEEGLRGSVSASSPEASEEEARSEANVTVVPHSGIAQAEADAAVAEELAAAETAAVSDASLFAPALRLSMAFALLQSNYSEQLSEIDPYATIAEQAVLTTLYVAKRIGAGDLVSEIRATGLEQLRIDAAEWAEQAGLNDLYESGVDTYAETIGVIRTYLGTL